MGRRSTLSDFIDRTNNEFSWRKKELYLILSMVRRDIGKSFESVTLRGAVALLYAHWEGFIKRIAILYLEHVSESKLTNGELSDEFLAIASRNLLRSLATSNNPKEHIAVVSFFRTQQSEKCRFDPKKFIRTSNLNSEVLEQIVQMLGLSYNSFSTKAKLIDESLLHQRNQIAHGEHTFVDCVHYENIHSEVLAMMQDYFNQIQNAAVNTAYKKI